MIFEFILNLEIIMKEFFETRKAVFLLGLVKYALFLFAFYIFSVGGIRGEIFPFAFGFFVALCWCDQNVFLMSGTYILASVLANFSFNSFLQCAFCCVVIIICHFVHRRFRSRIPASLIGVYAVLSQTAYLYFNLTDINQIVPSFLYLILGVLFMFACIKIFRILLVKGIGFKRTVDENICLCAFFVALGTGLSVISPFGFSLLSVVAVFFVLLSTFVFVNASVPIVIGLSFGLGNALQTGNLMMIAVFCALSLSAVAFKSTSKYFSIMSIIICDVFLGLYFNAYGFYTYKILISTIIGEVLFLCVSNETLAFLKALFAQKSGTLALRSMVNKSRDILCKRMFNLSEVFNEMDIAFKKTIRGVLPANQAKAMLKEEFLNKVCYDCPEKHRCHRVLAKETNETLDAIISAGLDRGRITLLDIPPFLSTRCNRTNIILNTINQLIANYKQYTYCITSVDTSKALVADEFRAVSKLLLHLAEETKQLVTFNEELEQKLNEDLNYFNIQPTETYVYERDGMEYSCVLTLRNGDLENTKLQEVLSKNFGKNMKMIFSEPAVIHGYTMAEFSPAPQYDCIYGSSGVAKTGSGVSGDSFSFIRLTSNKILLAICDGMGSGEDAQNISDTTISLIENFYKADFDDETILSSVNKLLSMQMTDNYSALDICVLDLQNCLADFVKVGAPACFVKHKDSTEVLAGSGALPIGILSEIQPSIQKKVLEAGDIVVLCSDGVTDAFEDVSILQNYINNIMVQNPQEIADIILGEAIKKNDNQPRDDMTVLCTRVFLNVL